MPSPFQNRTRALSTKSKVMMAVRGVFLIPPRLVMMGTAITTGIVLGKVCTMGKSEKELLRSPLGGWRFKLRSTFFPKCSRLFLLSLGFNKIEVVGKMATREEAPIVVCNHRAPWEALALSSITELSFISSDANFKMPLIGNIFYASQFVKVDRSDDQSKVFVEKEIRRRARDNHWNQVALFPEGTCGNGTVLMSFRMGAFSPALPIQPVVVEYPFEGSTGLDPSWAGWEVGLPLLTLRLMCQIQNPIRLTFLDVVRPTQKEQIIPKLYSDRVRDVMAAALKISKSGHSVEDTLVQVEALRLNLKPEDVVLGMESIRSTMQFTIDDVRRALSQFKQMDFDRNRVLSYEEFTTAMCIPDSDMMKEVWNVFTQGGKDGLTARDYIYSSIRVSKEMSGSNIIISVFDLIDTNHDKLIDFDEWLTFLKLASPTIVEAGAIRIFRRMDKDHEGKIDLFDFGSSLRERPTLMVFFLVALSKFGSTQDASKAKFLLSEVSSMCKWTPPQGGDES